jgi:probable rRNA maturation factor
MKINNELFESVFRIVKESEPLSENSHLSLILSNDGSIKKYNKQYLGRNELTDVISFQADIPGTGFLGDIIIDTNVADKQKDDRTLEEELQIIFLHGLLHLCGYDHLAANQEKIMKNKEKLYWNQLVNTYKLKENRSIKNK